MVPGSKVPGSRFWVPSSWFSWNYTVRADCYRASDFDLDLLIVADPLPDGRTARLAEFLGVEDATAHTQELAPTLSPPARRRSSYHIMYNTELWNTQFGPQSSPGPSATYWPRSVIGTTPSLSSETVRQWRAWCQSSGRTRIPRWRRPLRLGPRALQRTGRLQTTSSKSALPTDRQTTHGGRNRHECAGRGRAARRIGHIQRVSSLVPEPYRERRRANDVS